MPTYDYKCDACQHQWEEFQSIKADPTKKCPSCGKSKARRQIGGGAGLIFKGSGFYLTDYRSDSYKKAAEADKKASSGGRFGPQKRIEFDSENRADEKRADEEGVGVTWRLIMIRLPECPICHKAVPPASDPNSSFAPFCSRRCKEVDLVRWCDGRYAIVESIDPRQLADASIEEPGTDDDGDSSMNEDD